MRYDDDLFTIPAWDVDAPDFETKYHAAMRADPAVMAYELWEFTGLSTVAPLTNLDADCIRYVHDLNGPDQLGILAPRGVGKTHWGTAFGVVRDLYLDPTLNIIIRSKAGPEAEKTGRMIREWIEAVPWLSNLRPKYGQSWNDKFFSVGPVAEEEAKLKGQRQPSVTCIGILGQLPGNRGSRIYDDDIETDINTDTETARATLKTKALAAGAVRFNPPPGVEHGHVQWPRLITIGTRWHEDSVYDHMAAAGYHFRAYPLLYPTPQEREHCPGLAPIIVKHLEENPAIVGSKVFPRYRDTRVAQEQARGPIYFGRQFQQLRSVPGEERPPIELRHFIVVDEVPRFKAPISITWGTHRGSDSTVRKDVPMLGLTGDRIHDYAMRDDVLAPYTRKVGYLDNAGKGKDLFGVAIALALAGKIWIPVWRSRKGGVSENDLDEIVALMKYWDVRELFYESNNDVFNTLGEGLNAAVLRATVKAGEEPDYPNGWSCSVTADHATVQKEVRIIGALQVPVTGHNVVVASSELKPAPDLLPHQQLQYQLTRIRPIRHCLQEDGAADAGAGAVSKLKDILRVSSDTQAARKKAQLEDKEIDDHVKRYRGQKKARPATFHKR